MERDAASARQVEASNPANSTWLSANAGSGKTRVLTDRVARLLLAGTDPQNILCLTYTKAAASEMQNRLFGRLGKWAMMADAELRRDLWQLGAEQEIGAEQLAHARTLFARALETPGGLKIQTIHSFCANLLRRFPLEAGVSPQFSEMEDRTAALLRTEVVDALSMGPQAEVVDLLARHFGGDALDKLLAEITSRRDLFENLPDAAGLRRLFGLTVGLTMDRLLQSVLQPGTSDRIARLRALCQTGTANDLAAARKLASFNMEDNFGMADLVVLEDVFLTKASKTAKPYSAKFDTFPTKPLRDRDPELIAEIAPLMEAVEAARQDRLGLLALEQTAALHRFGAAFIPAYEARKLQSGLLDFDDLIRKARDLLTDPLVAQWVLFRLDGGIDHILVDEAQDTGPAQWAVIEQLSQEFATGVGVRSNSGRTLFVVGDKKQSIYSFQGADPDAFDRMHDFFAEKLGRTGPGIHPLQLEHSFRSAEPILRVVDETFAGPMAEGLGGRILHIAFKSAMPGRVDLWPVVEKLPNAEETRVWTDPLDQISEQHHDVRLARQVADAIFQMVATGTIPAEIGKTGTYEQRRITAGDVLILLPRRSDLFHEIIRACKARDLEIAGADRMRLGAELAVRDIAALLRFLALPEDDLSLAEALKSPLFGWSEQALFSLAHGRPPGVYLWQVLRNSDHVATLEVLQDLRARAEYLRPYDLINRVLIRHGGRKALLARLGAEAEDGIDALLAQALSYERNAVPDLTGFLEWMQADALEIKRQAEAKGSRIRVMTIHGAKGLESPIVILPDTAKRVVTISSALMPVADTAVWMPPVPALTELLQDQRNSLILAQERERRRLMYVAMTRAESWLIVCAAGDAGDAGDSWYRNIEAGMQRAGAVAQAFEGGAGLRVEGRGWADLPLRAAANMQSATVTVPAFPPLEDISAQTVMSPSGLGGAKIMPAENDDTDEALATAKGTFIHRLLEHLPQTDPARRSDLAAAMAAVEGLPDPGPLIADVMAMLEAPHLSAIFDSNALAEVQITAGIPAFGGKRFHGAIDRLLVRADGITAIDFKSNRRVPALPADVPEGLLRQMGAYLAMLREIYPDRPVTVAILWTATGELMPLPHDMLMAALQRATIA